MENSEKFINWLEGFLDASKNRLNSSQIREIRKKIKDYHEQEKNELTPIYDSLSNWGNIPLNGFSKTDFIKKTEENAEYLKEIEKNKNASTMEELV
jgi:hypothetical protein